MDDDLIAAIIATLRADSTLNTGVAGMIFPEDQVPAQVTVAGVTKPTPFPRGYVGTLDVPEQWTEQGSAYKVRLVPVVIQWAARTSDPSLHPAKDMRTLDARAEVVIRTLGVSCPNLVWMRRTRTLRIPRQDNDNVEYVAAGGIWTVRRDYDYS